MGDILGSISFDTFICSLVTNKIINDKLIQNEFIDFMNAHNWRSGKDTFQYDYIPKDLSAEAEEIIFHERIHYWQIISSSIVQQHFLYFLEKIRMEVMRINGKYTKICGECEDVNTSSLKCVAEMLDSFDSHMWRVDGFEQDWKGECPDPRIARAEVLINMIRGSNIISSSIFTDMPFMELPHKNSEMFLAGYGATLKFDTENFVIFPFNGVYLLESATHISNLLFQKKPMPTVEDITNGKDLQKLGTWEFWRRLHGPRYSSELCLALSFLAAIDLALNGIVYTSDEDDIKDNEYRSEMVSIPYRFGKIAYRLQGFPPFDLNGEDPAVAVARFQKNICKYFGWPAPDTSAKILAIKITEILFLNYYYMDKDILPYSDIIHKLAKVPHKDLLEKIEEFEPLWDHFNHTHIDVARIGSDILQIMLNSCIYRIKHPGEFCLPHIYSRDLISQFPLPLIMLNGRYYMDYPFPSNASFDLISLIALKSLADGRDQQLENSKIKCGFLDNDIDCYFVSHGYGCPYRKLATEEAEKRKKLSIDNFCHWTLRSVGLKIAEPTIQARWESIFSQKTSMIFFE